MTNILQTLKLKEKKLHIPQQQLEQVKEYIQFLLGMGFLHDSEAVTAALKDYRSMQERIYCWENECTLWRTKLKIKDPEAYAEYEKQNQT